MQIPNFFGAGDNMASPLQCPDTSMLMWLHTATLQIGYHAIKMPSQVTALRVKPELVSQSSVIVM